MSQNRAVQKSALVRRPGPRSSEGLVTHPVRVPVDVDLARRQWDGYVDALRAEGWETIEVPPADDCPDAVFVEDTVVVYGDLAVISRPGADERKPETAGTEATLPRWATGSPGSRRPAPLTAATSSSTTGAVWVGLGGRTNASGLEQLAALPRPLGAQVVGVPVSRVLHLKSAVTALPDGTVVGFEPLVDDPSVWSSFLAGARGGRRRTSWFSTPITVLMSTQRTRHPSALRVPRASRGRRRHLRIREARGLRHLPLGPTALDGRNPRGMRRLVRGDRVHFAQRQRDVVEPLEQALAREVVELERRSRRRCVPRGRRSAPRPPARAPSARAPARSAAAPAAARSSASSAGRCRRTTAR